MNLQARLEAMTRLAHMERSELIEAYEKECDARHELVQQAAKDAQKIKQLTSENAKLRDDRERKMVLIGKAYNHAKFAANRMGLNPNRVTLIATDDPQSEVKLLGMSLDPSTVFFVRGWKSGRYYMPILRSLAPALRRADGTPVGLDCIPYAPDPHFDAHEDDRWEHASIGLRRLRGEDSVLS